MKNGNEKRAQNLLRLKRLGIDSRNEHLVFMRSDCHVCVAEGFEALSRIRVAAGRRELVASLIVLENPELLEQDEIGLSKAAIKFLRAEEGDLVRLSHLGALDSMSDIRRKIYGHSLDENAFRRIVADTIDLSLSNIQLSAFLTACAGERLNRKEVVYLTKAMIEAGEKLRWDEEKIFDKHSVGGLPGNRTTPIVVSIAAAAGLTIPKTSSRAITSPAGTADTMETLTNVNLSVSQIKKVVKEEGGCLAWGGAVSLSPADDVLIRVERALDIDSEGQMIASVLSKKAAAGSTDVVIDIPVGKTAKVRSEKAALVLSKNIKAVGKAVGLRVETVVSDGSQPVGRGIGPALEAKDVLAVLQNEPDAPEDLASRAVRLAGKLLEMAGKAARGKGESAAKEILKSGAAWEKFRRICQKQGGLRVPPEAQFHYEIKAANGGEIDFIDSRKIAKIAKLAGAPTASAAGVLLFIKLNETVKRGQTLFEIHSEAGGELSYALEYFGENRELIRIKR